MSQTSADLRCGSSAGMQVRRLGADAKEVATVQKRKTWLRRCFFGLVIACSLKKKMIAYGKDGQRARGDSQRPNRTSRDFSEHISPINGRLIHPHTDPPAYLILL